MSNGEQDRLKGQVKGDAGRAERLAEELRRNLHRRKQRSRALIAQKRDTDRASAPPSKDDTPQ